MRFGSSRRRTIAVAVLGLAMAAGALSSTQAGAQTGDEDLTPQAIVDFFGVDLIDQIPATASSPAVVVVRLRPELADADLRARLHEPVTTRTELIASLVGPAATPLVATWMINDASQVAADDDGTLLSVPIVVPEGALSANPAIAAGGRPLPLRLELVAPDGTVLGVLTTFLTPVGGLAPPATELTVALLLDLRLPPSHTTDGGADPDRDALGRVLGLAEVLIDRDRVPLTIEISSETLDALSLIGDDSSLAVLGHALQGKQILTSPWTSLDIEAWISVGRADVVLDGLQRSSEALGWVDAEASGTMRFADRPTPEAVTAVTEPAAGVSGFVVSGSLAADGGPPSSVTRVTDASGGSHLMAQSDPFLEAMLRKADPELGAQWVLAELSRMAAEGTMDAVVVSAVVSGPVFDVFEVPWDVIAQMNAVVSGPVFDVFEVPLDVIAQMNAAASGPGFDAFESDVAGILTISALEPTALSLLLDGIEAHPSLILATVDDVLAQEPPGGAITIALADRLSGPGDFGLYLARLAQVEQRLGAYESFLGDDPALAAPLRTLLAVGASEHLTTGERTEFLNAVDQQATQGTTGVEFMGRGPITFTERNVDLPVTLVNNRPAPATVVLELTSDRIDFTHEERPVFTLEPGRNDLTVPVEAAASGRTSVRVTVTTPDPAGAITITTGTFSVRFADAEGLGLLILVWAAAALAAWWLQTLRRRSRDAASASGTVAAPGSGRGNAAD